MSHHDKQSSADRLTQYSPLAEHGLVLRSKALVSGLYLFMLCSRFDFLLISRNVSMLLRFLGTCRRANLRGVRGSRCLKARQLLEGCRNSVHKVQGKAVASALGFWIRVSGQGARNHEAVVARG